jgi:hypothetical protein
MHTGDEGDFVAEAAQDPTGYCEGAEEVGSEVCSLQTARLGFADAEEGLEVYVEVWLAMCLLLYQNSEAESQLQVRFCLVFIC